MDYRTLSLIIPSILWCACQTNPLQKAWIPQSPVVSSKHYECLEFIQPYTKGQVLAFSYESHQLGVRYHYAIKATSNTDSTSPKFLLQDEFGNTFTIRPQETDSCNRNSYQYCLSYRLPVDDRPIRRIRVLWQDEALQFIDQDFPARDLKVEVSPLLSDRDVVADDIIQRFAKLEEDSRNNLVTANIKRQAEIHKEVCGY
ncbi:hypothetical protein [Pseudobacteriovorax antillogorgiicola]|uniref:Lipoprotein n=1 Tax=Pseudobacteriovorax antillogorgiicola TaxID=1513793 RepID=A0A1Y6BX73_9BACT|nr:hypothetical protein [Pseudobacteriovorax antillogorgiicola]TCS53176.1 hypothetical protein EDD56_108227 [Pseudobacteriovorax antillogorgiicola]SMF24594.1 hypothetical protein SAMN06296036_10819 [Pseudobacteriovorax antillogorgiicola]